MASERIKYLTEQFINQTINKEEKTELANWVNHCLQDEELSVVLEQAWQKHTATKQMPEDMSERIKALIYAGEDTVIKEAEAINNIRFIPYWKRYRVRIAAAVFILMAGSMAYVKLYRQKHPVIAKTEAPRQMKQDVLPGGNKAVLTLSDGTQIVLDSASNGLLAKQGNAELRKLGNDKLAYVSTGASAGEVMYNTMTTPPGGQYRLLLPDGSIVWLNAASSIRFPTAFSGKERKVTITGEAYFEVATLYTKGGREKLPFIVQVNAPSAFGGPGDGGMEIQVLGTHFNVNAYAEEDAIKTTLLEGSVKIVKGNNSSTLLPGQQAQLQNTGLIKINRDADTEEAVAWKDGYFQFSSADLPTVLRQAARWYNLEVEFAGDIPKDRFTGKISRTVNLSRLLKWMQWSDVHFKLEGRKITVLP